ncbi:hypothetical protein [Marinospirillum sp.]|uniref:hypothetical protein n=1 Tax=Marinospirillum sp. TaxID=2183934 RepID=UPI0028700DE8|nr:hypothetical protein [Marinospirillum sp.]MDR9468485.1 hypothetical protein [Marinospirillum sp.]
MRAQGLIFTLLFVLLIPSLEAREKNLDWRLESQMSGHYYHWGESQLPEALQPEKRQQAGYLRTSLSHSGWFADLWLASNRNPQDGDQSWHPEVDELYYDFALESEGPTVEMTLGEKSLHWDYGFLALPLNWLGPGNDRSTTRHQADPLILAETYQGMTVFQSVCAWVDTAEEAQKYEDLCLLRSQGFVGKGEWQLLAGYQEDWLAGLGLAWTLTPALASYASASWKEQEEDEKALEALVGMTWASAQGLEVRAEHFWGNTDAALLRLSWNPNDWTWVAGFNHQELQEPLQIYELGMEYQLNSSAQLELNYFSYHPEGRPGTTQLNQEINLRLTYTTAGQLN